MWAILELLALIAIVLIFITEFFLPLLLGKPLFGSFRSKKKEQKKDDSSPLAEKVSEAKEKVKEVKDVQGEVTENFKTAEQLKEESDDLLK